MIADENFPPRKASEPHPQRNPEEGDVSDLNVNELLASLGRDVRELAGQEMLLAKTEASEKIDEIKSGSIHFGIGLTLLLSALGFGIVLIAIALSLGLQVAGVSMQLAYLASFAIMLVTTAGLGALGFKKAKTKLSAENLWPSKTAASLRETTNWARRKSHESN